MNSWEILSSIVSWVRLSHRYLISSILDCYLRINKTILFSLKLILWLKFQWSSVLSYNWITFVAKDLKSQEVESWENLLVLSLIQWRLIGHKYMEHYIKTFDTEMKRLASCTFQNVRWHPVVKNVNLEDTNAFKLMLTNILLHLFLSVNLKI